MEDQLGIPQPENQQSPSLPRILAVAREIRNLELAAREADSYALRHQMLVGENIPPELK